MKLILIVFLVSFLSACLILVQQNFILNKMHKSDFLCAKNILLFLFIIFYIIFINKNTYKNLTNMEISNWKYIIIDCFISIINIVLWYYLLQNTHAHKLVSTINPLTIIFITMLSYIFYKKKITKNNLFGIILVLIGLIYINKK